MQAIPVRSNPIVPMMRTDAPRGPMSVAFRPVPATEMAQHQQNAQASTAAKALGSKAQIDLLKAKIDNVRFSAEDLPTSNPLSKPPPSTLATVGSYLKYYGKGLLRTLETVTVLPLLVDKGARKDLAALMGTLKDSWDSTLANSDAAVGNQYIREGQKLVNQANQLDQRAALTPADVEFGMRQELAVAIQMRDTLQAKPVRSSAENAELSRLTEKAHLLDGHLGQVDHLRQQASLLRKQGESAVQLGMKVRGDKSELATKYLGYPLLLSGSAGKSAFTAVQAGTGLARGSGVEVSLEVGAKALGVTTQTLQLVGLAGAGVSAAIDGYDFYKTSKAHNQAMNKLEMAEALLTDHAGREKMAKNLDAEATRLEQPGLKGSMVRLGAKLNPFSDRTHPEVLRNKAIAIRAIDPNLSAATLDPAVKAVVTQIKEHADIDKKRMAMIKNVVGIVGAALTVAALTVVCPPAGLVVAACVIGVAAGGAGLYMSYNNWATGSQRFQNVVDLRQGLGQIELKQSLITREINQLEALPGAQDPDSQNGQKLTLLRGQQLELIGLRREATLNLLAASPDEAAVHIYHQAKGGDRQMHYLAKQVLGIDYENLPESVAIDALARGMHLDVNK
ncbi:MAG: hypothetical protein AB7I41_03295 [Candidatus Sericytochromatia bacterium]